MIDASGDTFRVGEGFYGDYVGDFDSNGNLWTFHSGLDRISVVDVDNFDTEGNPVFLISTSPKTCSATALTTSRSTPRKTASLR